MNPEFDAVYRVTDKSVETSSYAIGPWDPTMQHGSPPSALVTWIAEAIPTAVPMQIARVSIDLMRPVPVAPLTWQSEVIRQGRKIQLCAIKLLANGVVVVSATVLKIRKVNHELPEIATRPPLDVPLPDDVKKIIITDGSRGKFGTCMSIRSVRGGFGELGPGAVWYRLDRPIIEGQGISQCMRAVVASDFSNGTSAVLDYRAWTFLNADLNVYIAREPVGEWILLNSLSTIGNDGAGIAVSRLADHQGYFGQAVQTIVVEKR